MDSDNFRLARGFAAWILLVAAAVEVVMGAWTLSGLPGGPYSSAFPGGEAPGLTLAERGNAAIGSLVAVDITVLPVAAVLVAVTFGSMAVTARLITLAAVAIQSVALILGLVSWVAALGEPGRWLHVSTAADIAVAVAGLILTTGVLFIRAAR